jgi:sensor c-di-GMP phosphodiesterase-like protein
LISDKNADKDHELLELYSKVFEKSIEAMLIDMARNMDLTSIAESVETNEQLDCMKEHQSH